MNRILSLAVGVAILFGLAVSVQPIKAQVFDEYGITTVINAVPYQELTSKTIIPASKFALPPTYIEGQLRGRDDGFRQISLPWTFEFNGELYNSVWICVNGYIMLTPAGQEPPSTLVAKNGGMNMPDWLFYYSSSYPVNIIAPYMGDHFYRTGNDNPTPWPAANQYSLSEISYDDSDPDVFTVEWKNLNINFDDPDNIIPTAGITSSVASFQVKLYKSTDQYSKQGNIEFCYGQVNVDNPQTLDTRVITRNSAIGIKGNSGKDGEIADFLNGLYSVRSWVPDDLEDYDKDLSRTVLTTSTAWQPSGGTDYRVKFIALGRNQKEEFWGDGDTDLSQVEGQKHGGMKQNRFVTVGDARAIIRAIVTRQDLPRERRRQAYHADVNHNGRWFYYYETDWYGWNDAGTAMDPLPQDTTFKKKLYWRNTYYGDSISYMLHDVYDFVAETWEYNKVIPTQISSLSQIYFDATEYDAALIMHYIAGRITQLPYLIDSVLTKGKVVISENATGIEIGDIIAIDDNLFKVPVYLNGTNDGPMSLKMRLNGTITNMTSFSSEMMLSYQDDMLVIAGADEFNTNTPVCYITVSTDDEQLNFSEIRFNDVELPSISLMLTSIENSIDSQLLLSNSPNPFTEYTDINVNIPEDGNYTLRIYDVMGNIVKTYKDISTGQYKWYGIDENGNYLGAGVYIYRLTGNNLNIAKKLILAR